MGLEFRAGDKLEYFLFLKDKNGNPLDLTNVTEYKVAWKTDPDTADNVILKTGDGSGTPITAITPLTDGKIKINLEPSDTDITPACLAHAAQIVESGSPLTLVFDEDNIKVEVKAKQFA